MNDKQIADALNETMKGVHLSSELRANTLHAIREGQEGSPKMKRKISAVLIFALVGVLAVTVALAVANYKGVLDFITPSETALPPDAADYVQKDIASAEKDGLHAAVREAVYDGNRLRMTVEIRMDGDKPLLTGLDISLDDRWAWPKMDESDTDSRTIQEVYRTEKYTDAYYIAETAYDTSESVGNSSGNIYLQDDGTLTAYHEIQFEQEAEEREITLHIRVFKYLDVETMELDAEPCTELELKFTVRASDIQEERYVNAEPILYESIGVCVDRVTMTVKPLEIDYTLAYTVVDAEKFARTDDGLWFEWIDPNSQETVFFDQRLKEGFSSADSVRNVDETHYRQTGTLSLDERAEVYTLRAYECWDKQRFETHEIRMVKAE